MMSKDVNCPTQSEPAPCFEQPHDDRKEPRNGTEKPQKEATEKGEPRDLLAEMVEKWDRFKAEKM